MRLGPHVQVAKIVYGLRGVSGPAPKLNRRRTNAPERGDWQRPDAIGWQHGEIPEPPPGLTERARWAWATWFAAWFAAFWTPADIPGLRIVAGLYDQLERGHFERASEWRSWASAYGITPAGQRERRWIGPEEAAPQPAPDRPPSSSHTYDRLHLLADLRK